MSQEPKLPTPTIEPQRVAKAILQAAVRPVRAKKVGLKATINTTVATMFPAIADRLASREVNRQQYHEPPRNAAGILRQSSESSGAAGRTHGAGGKTDNQ